MNKATKSFRWSVLLVSGRKFTFLKCQIHPVLLINKALRGRVPNDVEPEWQKVRSSEENLSFPLFSPFFFTVGYLTDLRDHAKRPLHAWILTYEGPTAFWLMCNDRYKSKETTGLWIV